MIRDNTLARQMVRLSVLAHREAADQGTADEVWAEDIEAALRANAKDDRRVIDIVDFWIRDQRWRPAASDIHDIGAYLAERDAAAESAAVPRDRKCPQCSGTGYEIQYRLTTYEGHNGYNTKRVEPITEAQYVELRKQVDGRSQRVDSGARRCTACEYGRHLQRAADTAPADETPRATRRKSASWQHADARQVAAGGNDE